jgi:hypothetical protein
MFNQMKRPRAVSSAAASTPERLFRMSTQNTLVVTYQHGVLPGVYVDLCDECTSRGDHEHGVIGPCSHGAHDGECEGANHGAAARRRTYRVEEVQS